MRKTLVALIALLLVVAPALLAGDTDTITVSYEVQAINELAISGGPVSLIINSATAGSEPDDVTDSSTATYALTTNGTNKKLTARVDLAMPAETHLYLTLVAPTGATSAGEQELTETAVSVVTSIATVAESALGMTFRFSATVDAGIIATANRTVTLVLTDG